MSVSILVIAYVLQQRFVPYVVIQAISEGLQLTASDLLARLQRQQDAVVQAPSASSTMATSSHRSRGRAAAQQTTHDHSASATTDTSASTAYDTDLAVRMPDMHSSGAGAGAGAVGAATAATAAATGAGAGNNGDTGVTGRVWVSSEPPPRRRAASRRVSVADALRVSTARSARAALSSAVRVVLFMVDYNHLESSFLIAGIMVLLLGMVFTSNGFAVVRLCSVVHRVSQL